MTAGSPAGGNRFARAVERRLERLLRKAVVLSPKDWTTLAGWEGRGIPLALVLETLDEVAARKAGPPPRSLAYFARAVEECWRAMQEGRTLRPGAGPAPAVPRDDPAAPWESARRSGTLPPGVEARLVDLTAAIRRGEPLSRVDEALDRALLDERTAPEAHLEARRSALAALAVYRDRMTPAAWSRTLDLAITERMRAELGLPRLHRRRGMV